MWLTMLDLILSGRVLYLSSFCGSAGVYDTLRNRLRQINSELYNMGLVYKNS